ncbi:MAG: taurine dioxygenase [Gammaproteobacteria bacterium]|nr:taurine dioxygenase [Gammaproteobacteria bacterium]OUU09765.1 MAG: hypothetical protein CBB94_06825 [Gammaproteobacteria bacterium TMED34]
MGAALGAEIRGLDLSADPVSKDDATALIDALHDHLVVVIRGPILTPDDLLRCGELKVHPVFPHLEGYPPIVVIENHGKQYAVNEHWHSDVMFSPTPPAYTLLHALEVPAVGGATQFSNQYLAYDGLSNALKSTIAELNGIKTGAGAARLAGNDAADAPEAIHPVVRTHPDTGRKSLFAYRAFTTQLDRCSEEDSRSILEALFAESCRYEYTWRHQWQNNDLVIWDNRCVLHYAIHDHGDRTRLLHRCTVTSKAHAEQD